jgi:hypothetical protein
MPTVRGHFDAPAGAASRDLAGPRPWFVIIGTPLVLVLAPGGFGVTESNWREATARVPHFCISESPVYVSRAVTALAADPDVSRWSGQVLSSGQLAGLYGFC